MTAYITNPHNQIAARMDTNGLNRMEPGQSTSHIPYAQIIPCFYARRNSQHQTLQPFAKASSTSSLLVFQTGPIHNLSHTLQPGFKLEDAL